MMRHVPEPMGYIAEMPEIVRMEGGEQAIEIRFSGELTRALADAELPLGVYLGMLTRTLMGVVPGVDGVHVLIDGKAVSALGEADTPDGTTVSFQNGLMESDDFLSWIGAPVVFLRRGGAERKAGSRSLRDAGAGRTIRARSLRRCFRAGTRKTPRQAISSPRRWRRKTW